MTDTPNKGGRPRSTDPRTMRGWRATTQEWATYQALGGSAWLAARLKSARLTPEQQATRARILAELGGQQTIDDGTTLAPCHQDSLQPSKNTR